MRHNIYIRIENEEAWQDIENPSDWINTLLAHSGDTREYGKVIPSPAGPTTVALTERVYDFCKHDAIKGLCKKGCK